MGQEKAVDRQRSARRQEWHVAIGKHLPPPFEEAALLRVAGEGHPVARHEERPGCRDEGVAGGIAAVEPPFAGAPTGAAGRRTGEPLEPGDGAAGRIGERHFPSADTHRPRPPRLPENGHGRVPFAGAPPGNSAHHDEGRLILLVSRSAGQPFEPRRRLEWPATLQGVERREHRRPSPRWGVKPTPGHRHNRDRIVGSDRLLEEPVRAGTELDFVGSPPGVGERPEEPARFRLDAPPGALASRRTEEKVAVAPEDFVDERRRIAPAFVGDEAADAVELTLLETVGGERDAPVVPPFAGFVGRRVGVAGPRGIGLRGRFVERLLARFSLLGNGEGRPRAEDDRGGDGDHQEDELSGKRPPSPLPRGGQRGLRSPASRPAPVRPTV